MRHTACGRVYFPVLLGKTGKYCQERYLLFVQRRYNEAILASFGLSIIPCVRPETAGCSWKEHPGVSGMTWVHGDYPRVLSVADQLFLARQEITFVQERAIWAILAWEARMCRCYARGHGGCRICEIRHAPSKWLYVTVIYGLLPRVLYIILCELCKARRKLFVQAGSMRPFGPSRRVPLLSSAGHNHPTSWMVVL